MKYFYKIKLKFGNILKEYNNASLKKYNNASLKEYNNADLKPVRQEKKLTYKKIRPVKSAVAEIYRTQNIFFSPRLWLKTLTAEGKSRLFLI